MTSSQCAPCTRRGFTCFTLLSFAAALAVGTPAAAQTPSIRGVGDLPGGDFRSNISGVSADGAVVSGYGVTDAGSEAFRWTAATGLRGLGTLPGQTQSLTFGMSGNGQTVVGVAFTSAVSRDHAIRWTEAGGVQDIGAMPGSQLGAHAYSASFDGSVIVGTGDSSQGRQGYRWTQATGVQPLGDLPGGEFDSFVRKISSDGSAIVGVSYSSNGGEAFRWTSAGGMQGLGDLPGGSFASEARDVSADGAVIVGHGWTAEELRPFRWTAGGGMVDLGLLPGWDHASASVVSADASTVYGDANVGNLSQGFVWDATRGLRELETALAAEHGLNLGGWRDLSVAGVSADGLTLVGNGVNPANLNEGFVIVLPEPACGALVIAAGVFSSRRRLRCP